MSYTPPATTLTQTPTVGSVLTDITNFAKAIVGPGVPIIRGIVNRTAAPPPQSGFIVITPIYQERLEWNTDTYSVLPSPPAPFPASGTVQLSMRIDVQCDVYGTGGFAGTWASMLMALWRDDFACSLMQNSQPLYADEARMIPLVDSEAQYEERWSLTLTAQYNPVITPPLLFATSTEFEMVDVEGMQEATS